MYILFQLFRLASLVRSAISLVDYKLKPFLIVSFDDASSIRLAYYKWNIIWLTCSILTSIICICLLNQKVLPELRPVGHTVVLKCLFLKPYFWSLSSMTVLVTTCDIILSMQPMKKQRDAKITINCLLTFSRLMTLYLIYQLNFTYPPSKARGFRFTSIAGYFVTLSIFFLDNLWNVVAASVKIAYEATVNDTRPNLLYMLNYLILMLINASLSNAFLQFFWQKIFSGDKNILRVYKENLADTCG